MQKSAILFLILLPKYDNRDIESNMQYPLISEYIDAIRSAEDNFDKLNNLRPVLDDNGNPIMSSGNFAVVFKMKDVNTGKLYAVKCFTREQEHRNENYQKIARELEMISSPYLVHFSYLEKELFVDTTQSDEEEFPVLLMDWVEGQPLDAYIRKHLSDDYERQMLTHRFCQMGAWLLSQPFAHGDLKPDNILVKQDGTLVLVDYDGMYVPSMQGQKAQELGSPDYRHPLRTEDDFNEHIDDFAIANIALSLKAISINTSIYRNNGKNDILLFSIKDYQDITNSESIRSLHAFLYDKELFALYNLFLVAYNTCSIGSSILLTIKEPAPKIYKDGELIVIPEGKNFIECGEYEGNTIIKCVKIPTTVSRIEECAFSECSSLEALYIPNNVNKIGSMAFYDCFNLKFMRLPDNVTIEGSALTNCNKELQLDCSSLEIVNGLVLANNRTLVISCLDNIINVVIPDGVIKIESGAFGGCSKIESIYISMGCKEIGCGAFYTCTQLKKIFIPSSITEWNVGWDSGDTGTEPFCECTSLKSIYISPCYKQKLLNFKNLHLFADKIKELYDTQLFEYMD